MKINFLTIFPRYYEPFVSESIIKNAIKNDLVSVDVIDWRQYAKNKHKNVDDKVYGGGAGMLLMVEPIHQALKELNGFKILVTPQGKKLSQALANELATKKEITFIAGRYEGFDERVRNFIDLEVSIGDYVLTGGELPSMVIADVLIRLIPGVINEESVVNDSFSKKSHLLDYPHYTRPEIYNGMIVPKVLLSGNHAKIQEWRNSMQIEKTKKNRPDLWKEYINDK